MIALLIFACPLSVWSAELNAGFVQGLWYNDETVIVGKPTRIYVAFRNTTNEELTGSVRFEDNGELIGITSVSALTGRVVEAWMDWTPAHATHTIVAKLENIQVNAVGGESREATISNAVVEDTLFVDYDTDADGIPNQTDTDDDNDAISDTDEITAGTNPLVKEPVKQETKNSGTESDAVENNRNDTDEVGILSPSVKGASTGSQNGLEQYLGSGAAHAALNTVTETIHETKNDLDAYRERRSDALKDYFKNQMVTVEEEHTNPDGTVGTITRSQVRKDETFFEKFVRGGKALVFTLYTFLLWAVSNTLAHPALVELLILLLIIYLVYRTARRFGRRRRNY